MQQLKICNYVFKHLYKGIVKNILFGSTTSQLRFFIYCVCVCFKPLRKKTKYIAASVYNNKSYKTYFTTEK